MKEKSRWSHWENTAAGVVAVFHYEVPKAASHYEINTPVEQIEHNTGSNRWASAGGMAATVTTAMVHNKPGYQGSLWVDPATGTIVRVTLVADLKGDSAIQRVAILVDYGPVHIANKTVICPVRSLALASAPATVNASLKGAATEWFNENLFHRLPHVRFYVANSHRAVCGSSPAGAIDYGKAHLMSRLHLPPVRSRLQKPLQPDLCRSRRQPHPSRRPQASSRLFRLRRRRPWNKTRQVNEAGSMSEQPQAATPILSASVPATITASQPEPISPSPVPSFSKAEPQYSAPPIDVNVNRVLVPVVVRDKQGRTVADLKKEDFQVLDEGKLRSISAFNLEKRGSIGSQLRNRRRIRPAAESNC